MRRAIKYQTLLLRYLEENPTLGINRFLLRQPVPTSSENDVANSLAMSRATFFKYCKELERPKALIATRKIGKQHSTSSTEPTES